METNVDYSEKISANINDNEIRKLLVENYDIIPENIKPLNGYDDLNFHISSLKEMKNKEIQSNHHGYVLKIINWKDSSNEEFLSTYIDILLHLRKQNITAPYPVRNNTGEYKMQWSKKGEDKSTLTSLPRVHVVLLLEFIFGTLLEEVNFEEKFCYSLGQISGKLHNALKPFCTRDILQRPDFLWSLKFVSNVLKYAEVIEDEAKRVMAVKAVIDFQENVLTRMDEMEQGIIHGDLNQANLLVIEKNKNDPEICGIIDFSDISHSCYLFELAIIITYLSMDRPDRLQNFAASLISGYPRRLTDLELNLLKNCICARLAQSLILGMYSYKLCPSNVYLLTTQKHGWPMLQQLQNTDNEEFVVDIKKNIKKFEN